MVGTREDTESEERHTFPHFVEFRIWYIEDCQSPILVRLTVLDGKCEKETHLRLLERYKRIFNEALGSDFVIKVQGKKLEVSKAILMGQWDHFRNMIESNMAEKNKNEMVIDDFKHDLIKALLGFLYSGSIELKDVDFAMDLLAASEKYAVVELKDACQRFLIDNLTKDSSYKMTQFDSA